eukprot:1144337-Prorocentrum_minimum.AAC.1
MSCLPVKPRELLEHSSAFSTFSTSDLWAAVNGCVTLSSHREASGRYTYVIPPPPPPSPPRTCGPPSTGA